MTFIIFFVLFSVVQVYIIMKMDQRLIWLERRVHILEQEIFSAKGQETLDAQRPQ